MSTQHRNTATEQTSFIKSLGSGAFSKLSQMVRENGSDWVDNGMDLLTRIAAASQNPSDKNAFQGKTVEGTTSASSAGTTGSLPKSDPLYAFRQQVPTISRQLLGSRYATFNRFTTRFVPESVLYGATDQVFSRLAQLAAFLSDKDDVAEQAGLKDFSALGQKLGVQKAGSDGAISEGQASNAANPLSNQISRAVTEQNRMMAIAEGMVTGATGLVGAVSDLPLILVLSLRTIYQIGHAYGFALDDDAGRALVMQALSEADLSPLAEKQAVLVGLATVRDFLEQGDLAQLQQMAGSHNNTDALRKIANELSSRISLRLSPSILGKVMPVLAGAAGGMYNARVIKAVAASAQKVFAEARQTGSVTQQVSQLATELTQEDSAKKQAVADKSEAETSPAVNTSADNASTKSPSGDDKSTESNKSAESKQLAAESKDTVEPLPEVSIADAAKTVASKAAAVVASAAQSVTEMAGQTAVETGKAVSTDAKTATEVVAEKAATVKQQAADTLRDLKAEATDGAKTNSVAADSPTVEVAQEAGAKKQAVKEQAVPENSTDTKADQEKAEQEKAAHEKAGEAQEKAPAKKTAQKASDASSDVTSDVTKLLDTPLDSENAMVSQIEVHRKSDASHHESTKPAQANSSQANLSTTVSLDELKKKISEASSQPLPPRPAQKPKE